MRDWEKKDLIPAKESFGWLDVVALRALQELRKSGVPFRRVCESVKALRATLGDVTNPLTEVRVYADGKRIRVQVAGRKMEPLTGQLLLDFDKQELSRLLSFPGKQREEKKEAHSDRIRRLEAERWFQNGLNLEMAGAPMEEIVAAYLKAIENDPTSAGALVNLGTAYFNARDWKQAEAYYRRALEADSTYPLAHFNLGNLFDERGDRTRAESYYLAAVELSPQYADAHYNLALLYQGTGQALKAVRHWRIYLKLDPSSSWSVIARRELEKLRAATIVRGRSARAPEALTGSTPETRR